MSKPNWLQDYHSRLVEEYKISMERKDKVLDWSIGILFVAIVAYADLLTNSAPSIWRIGLLVGLSCFIMRMFGNSCLAYGYLRKWRYLLDNIEGFWKWGKPSLNDLYKEIGVYHHTKKMTEKCSYFVKSQLKVGFFLLFIVPVVLIAFEFITYTQDWKSWFLVVLLTGYYIYEGILLKQIDAPIKKRKVIDILKSWVPVIIIILLVVSLVTTYFYRFDSGQLFVAGHIRHNVSVVTNLSSFEVQSEIREFFPEKLNYTQLFIWQSTRMNFTQKREVHTDPLEILDYGKGACGEFSIVYVAICLANDIPARLLVTGYIIPGKVDHTWAEVNPSKDGETWIHVDPSDSVIGVQQGKSVDELTSFDRPSMYQKKDFKLVLAFEPTQDGDVIIIDRTETYSPNQ